MDLEGHTHKVNGRRWIYRHNNKDFCENFIFSKSINRERMTIKRCPCKTSGTSPLSSLPLVLTSVQEEIRPSGDCVDTSRGWTLGQLKNSFK